MHTPKKNVVPLVLGIVSIISGLLFAIVGVITGIIGLILANNENKNEGLNYKTEIILSSIGIAVSIINMILGFLLYSSLLK